jgi:signal transduction histidine kinase
MRLAEFIRENTEDIIGEWEDFARTLAPAAADMSSHGLRDHIRLILAFIANDVESPQTAAEQVKKSRGEKIANPKNTAAETHAAIRLAGGFDLNQMVSEYRALRASVVKLWGVKTPSPAGEEILDLTRFNESVDQELTESISHYTKKVGHSKDLFLGILSHDLRTPINAALMSAQLVPKIGTLNQRQTMLCFQIVDCASRANEIVTNLFDLTRARFGSGLPVVRELMDMGFLSRQLAEEMRVVYPTRAILLEVAGDLEGEWDKARIGQVFSNLIGNAAQYGFEGLPVTVKVEGTKTEVILSVHNEGVPIPADVIGGIFDSLTRGTEDGDGQAGATHLGLGLYITKEIVISHGGTIGVSSSEKGGTTFTAHFPRLAQTRLNLVARN